MKYIISENKVTNVIKKYLKNLISLPEFSWVDDIDVKSDGNSFPFYTYVVHFNDENPDSNSVYNLSDKIGFAHRMVFPIPEDNGPSVMWLLYAKTPDGDTKFYPKPKRKS